MDYFRKNINNAGGEQEEQINYFKWSAHPQGDQNETEKM